MNLSNGISVIYRVSDTLRQEKRESDSCTRLLHVLEQCGCFYYFKNIESAVIAMKEFNTSIDVVRASASTKLSDHLFPPEDVIKLKMERIDFNDLED